MSTVVRGPEALAVARLAAGADLPSWVASASLMSVTATAASTTVVCAAGAVPRKARPEGPYAAFEVHAGPDEVRTGALVAVLGALPEGAEVRIVSTVDHDWLLLPHDAADLVAAAWRDAGHDVTDAPTGAPTDEDHPERTDT